ncbi:MAG: PAS domain S-box protein [Ignavibacteriota bacterium]
MNELDPQIDNAPPDLSQAESNIEESVMPTAKKRKPRKTKLQLVDDFHLRSESEDRLQLAVQLTGVGIWDFNPQSGELNWSEECKKIYGLPDGVTVDYALFAEHIFPEDKSIAESAIAKALDPDGDGTYNVQYRIIRFTGDEVRWIKTSGKVYFNADRVAQRFIGTVMDITDDVNREEKLRKSIAHSNEVSTRYKSLVDGLPIAFYTCDKEGVITYYNQAAAQLWGREPVIGKDMWCGSWKIFWTDGSPVPLDTCPMGIALKEGRAVKGAEIIVERPDGELRNVLPHPQPIFDADGNVTGAFNLLVDITERRKSDRAVRQSEANLHALFDNTKDGFVLADISGTIIAFNNAASSLYQKIFGIELRLGATAKEVLGEERGTYVLAAFEKVIAGETIERTSKQVTFDGKEYWLRGYYNAVRSADGSVTGVCMGISDITEEIARQEKMLLMASIVQNSEDAIYSTDLGGLVTSWNAGAEKLFAMSAEEILGKTLVEEGFIGNADEEKNIRLRIQNGESFQYTTKRFKRDGTRLECTISLTPIHNSSGETIGVSRTLRDITEQTRFYEDMRESEERFRSVADSAAVLIWMTDSEKNCDFVNKGWLNYTGRSMKEESGQGRINSIIENDRERYTQVFESSFDRRVGFTVDFRLRSSDGHYRWFSDSGIPRFLPDGTFLGYIGTCIDINDRVESRQILEAEVAKRTKDYEEANRKLIQSEERFHHMIEEVHDYAIILLDREGNVQSWNKGAVTIKGYSAEEIIGKNFSIFYDPEERAANVPKQMIERCIEEGKASYEAWRVRKDGSKFWGYISLTPLRDESGTVIGFTKVTRDLTEKKHAEISLKLLTERLQEINEELLHEKDFIESVLDASVDLITVYDLETRVISVNKQVEELLGLRREDLIGKKYLELFPDSVSSLTYEHLLHAIDGKFGRYVHPKGSLSRAFEIFMIPLKRNGKVYAVIALTHDITSLVDMSEKVQESNTILEEHNRNLSLQYDELAKQKELIETIIDTSVDFIGVYSKEMKLISINKKTLDVMKKTKEELIGKTYDEINEGKPENPEVRADLLKAMNGEPIHRVYPKSAESFGRDYEIFYIPLIHQNEVYATLAMVHDITEIMNISERLKISNTMLEEKNIDLQRSNTELEQFAYIASHDLQEPLRKIRTFTKLVQQHLTSSLDETSDTYLRKIHAASDRMSELIKDVLNYSRLSSGELDFLPINIQDTVGQVLTDLDILISEKNAEIIYEGLPIIDAIGHQMDQLFHNLLNNALKFTKPDTKPIIQIRSEKLSISEIRDRKLKPGVGYCKLTVKDNGMGFEQEYAERIFIVFQRLNGRQEFGGTGIGLALCRKIVTLHEGIIEARSSVNEGAEFTIILPMKQVREKEKKDSGKQLSQ